MAQSSSCDWITTLDVPEDSRFIAILHYYEPFHSVHQRANWIGQDTRSWLGTTRDVTPAEKVVIHSTFDLVANWAQRHRHLFYLVNSVNFRQHNYPHASIGLVLSRMKQNSAALQGHTRSSPPILKSMIHALAPGGSCFYRR